MNEILLILTLLLFGGCITHLTKISLISSASGFLIGLFYFTLVPVCFLALFDEFGHIRGTRIPAISWRVDANTVTILLLMSVQCFIVLFFMGGRFGAGTASAKFGRVLQIIRIPLNTPILFVAYLTSATALFFATGLGAESSHWNNSRTEYIQEYGILGSIMTTIPHTLRYVVLLRCFTRLFKPGDFGSWLTIGGVLACDLYTSGTRFLLFQSIAVIAFLAVAHRAYKPILLMAMLAIPLAIAMDVFTYVRADIGRWSETTTSGALDALARATGNAMERLQSEEFYKTTGFNITEAASLGIFKHTANTFGRREPYLYGKTFIKPLVAWIPRSVWPDKPFNFTWILGIDLVKEGVSVNSTTFGEFYGNFGMLGGFLAPIVLLIYTRLLTSISLGTYEVNSILCFILGIASARNGFMESAIPLVLCILVLNIVGYHDSRVRTGASN